MPAACFEPGFRRVQPPVIQIDSTDAEMSRQTLRQHNVHSPSVRRYVLLADA
jgi:hypothetical protein